MKLKEICKKKQQSRLSSDEMFDFYLSLDGSDKSKLLKSIENLKLFSPIFNFYTNLGKDGNVNEMAYLLKGTEWFLDKNSNNILSLRHTGRLTEFNRPNQYYPYLADDGKRYPIAKLIRFDKIAQPTNLLD